ncbi:hypothetical protein VPH35_067507 [Triticum aestivum]
MSCARGGLPFGLVRPGRTRFFSLSVRNIVVLQGYIKYFEMHNNVRPSSYTGSSPILEGWIAATKKIKISSIGSGSNWEEDCTIRCCDDVPVDNPVYAQMLPNPQEGDDTKPNLKKICVGYPALSLHDGDVVYLMHTLDPRQVKACVIVLDMRNKTVKGVANFGSGRRLGYHSPTLRVGSPSIWAFSHRPDLSDLLFQNNYCICFRMVNIVSAFILLAFTFPSKNSALAAPCYHI